MDVERVVHRVVRVHLVDQPHLHLVTDSEFPVDCMVFGAGCAVDQLPAHVLRRGHPVDLDHVVLPLDGAGSAMPVALAVVRVLIALGVMVVSLSGVVVLVGAAVQLVFIGVVLMVIAMSFVLCTRVDERGGQEFIPHSGQRPGSLLTISGCMGQVYVVGAAVASSAMPHFGQRPGSSRTTSGCIGQAYTTGPSGTPMSISATNASVLSGALSRCALIRAR